VADRLAGVVEELDAADLDPADIEIEHDAFSRDGGMAACGRLLGKGMTATAILALTDVMAMGALAVLRQAGRSVPAEISVMGFDDVTVAADLARR